MTRITNQLFKALLVFTVITSMIGISSCSKDETPKTTTYPLKVKDVLGVTGTVKFTETSPTVTTVEITLTGASNHSHPAHIHLNSAIEGGSIAISLNDVDANGSSVTTVTKLDNGTAISYNQLIAFDGYVNVHDALLNLGTIIAQGDIGGNAITTTQKSYTLTQVGSSAVSGTALFEKRNNGTTLVTVSLTGTLPGGSHPSHIHLGSVATVGGGPIVITLGDVDGSTGKGYTQVRKLNSGTAITYDDLLVYDGYINVHESAGNLGNILCQGNIGSN